MLRLLTEWLTVWWPVLAGLSVVWGLLISNVMLAIALCDARRENEQLRREVGR